MPGLVVICIKCKVGKSADNFYLSKTNRRGLMSYCKACANKISRKWTIEHPERIKQAARKWYKEHSAQNEQRRQAYREKNPGKRRELQRRWRSKYPEKGHEYGQTYRKRHPDRVNARNCNRRAWKRQAEGTFTKEEWQTLCASYGNKCLRCHRTDVPLARDHVIPIGPPYFGSNFIWNIQPLCRSCNSKKHKRIDDYRFDHRFEKAG